MWLLWDDNMELLPTMPSVTCRGWVSEREPQEAAGAPHEGQYSHLYAAAWQSAVE